MNYMYIYKISYISMYSVIGPTGQDLDHDEVHGCINTCAVQVMTPMDAFNIEITPATWRQKWEQESSDFPAFLAPDNETSKPLHNAW